MENYNKYYINNQNLKGDELLVEFEKRRLVILDLIDDVTILKNRVHKKDNEIDVLKKKNNELVTKWNELKEYIKNYIEELESLKENVEYLDLFEQHTLENLEEFLGKMQELESKGNND